MEALHSLAAAAHIQSAVADFFPVSAAAAVFLPVSVAAAVFLPISAAFLPVLLVVLQAHANSVAVELLCLF